MMKKQWNSYSRKKDTSDDNIFTKCKGIITEKTLESIKLSDLQLSQRHLKAAIANNRLSGSQVTNEMIIALEQALIDNPELDRSKIVALLLKEDVKLRSQ